MSSIEGLLLDFSSKIEEKWLKERGVKHACVGGRVASLAR